LNPFSSTTFVDLNMPELPEVETTKRGIAPYITGRKLTQLVIRQPNLRWPIDPALPKILANQPLLEVWRRGKYLIFHFPSGWALIHLGMSGSLRIIEGQAEPRLHDHVDWVFDTLILRFHDPRRFGCLIWTESPPESHPLLAKLGPEPLSDAFQGDFLFQKSRKSSLAIKQFIMDSHKLVGVGNIYAAEALFTAGIRPSRQAKRLTKADCHNLAQAIKQILQTAINHGGTSLRDFVDGHGNPGYFKQELRVYDRGGLACVQCSHLLKEIRMNGRSSVYCPHCQS
jgi:formamidopyrimidine-DNA glycosylase